VEASSLVKDTRIAEIIWMTVIAIVVAAGGNIVLGTLALHRGFATVLLAAVVVAALLAVRRAMAANARIDVTKAATYLVAAVFAFVAIGLHVHWAIGATIAAAEAAIVFDIVTIAARPKAAPGKELP
jgi:hypothetical protein